VFLTVLLDFVINLFDVSLTGNRKAGTEHFGSRQW